MRPQDDSLVTAYQTRGLLDAQRTPRHLPTACANHGACWDGVPAEHVPPPGHVAAEISPPWIGESYSDGRLVIVLENLRNYGGWDLTGEEKGLRYLARHARDGFARGDKVLFRGGRYGGTRVWYQAVAYAAVWLTGSDAVGNDALVSAVDRVAIVEHVKCSPLDWRRSNPTGEMWNRCGAHVLRAELDVLQPERILIVGRGNNASAMRASLLGPTRVVRSVPVTLGRRRTELVLERCDAWRADAIVVPHPATLGGGARSLVRAFAELVSGPRDRT